MDRTFSREFPLDPDLAGADAELVVHRGLRDVRIQRADDPALLAAVDSEDAGFEAEASARGLELRHGSFFAAWLRGRPFATATSVALSAERRWSFDLRGGVSELDADLCGLDLGSIRFRGGVSGLVVSLPKPDRVVPIRIEGGLVNAFFLRPQGVPFAVSIRGGASDLRIDGSRFGAIGSGMELGEDALEARGVGYRLEVAGGVSVLAVDAGQGSGRASQVGEGVALASLLGI